jgi:hypothetical protein
MRPVLPLSRSEFSEGRARLRIGQRRERSAPLQRGAGPRRSAMATPIKGSSGAKPAPSPGGKGAAGLGAGGASPLAKAMGAAADSPAAPGKFPVAAAGRRADPKDKQPEVKREPPPAGKRMRDGYWSGGAKMFKPHGNGKCVSGPHSEPALRSWSTARTAPPHAHGAAQYDAPLLTGAPPHSQVRVRQRGHLRGHDERGAAPHGSQGQLQGATPPPQRIPQRLSALCARLFLSPPLLPPKAGVCARAAHRE